MKSEVALLPECLPSAAYDATAAEAGLDSATFRFTRDNANGVTTVNYTVDAPNSTATSGSDYQALSGSVTFNVGELFKDVVLTPVNDSLAEPTETVTIKLSAGMPLGMPGHYLLGAQTTATASILDNDAATVNITALDSTAKEAGLETGTFRITRSHAIGALTVNYAVDGTSTASGSDCTGLGMSVTFANGEISKDIVLTPVNDTLPEALETVVVKIIASGPPPMGTYYIIGPNSQATVTIEDEDNHPPQFGNFATTVDVAENTPIATVLLTAAATDPENSPLTYSITSGNGLGLFGINSATGGIFVAQPLDYEALQQPQFILSLRVQDPQGLFDTETVTIKITNVNEPPNARITVTEDGSGGWILSPLDSLDPEGHSVTLQWSINGIQLPSSATTLQLSRQDIILIREAIGSITFQLAVFDGVYTSLATAMFAFADEGNTGPINLSPSTTWSFWSDAQANLNITGSRDAPFVKSALSSMSGTYALTAIPHLEQLVGPVQALVVTEDLAGVTTVITDVIVNGRDITLT